jgi:hypothetical protein
MASPIPLSAGDKILTVVSPTTLATAQYIPVPMPGRIKLFQGVLGAALSTADETFTLAYAPPGSTTYTNVTNGAFTIATASSAAGNVGSTYVAPSTTAYIVDGGSLRITPSGGGGGAVPMTFIIIIGP